MTDLVTPLVQGLRQRVERGRECDSFSGSITLMTPFVTKSRNFTAMFCNGLKFKAEWTVLGALWLGLQERSLGTTLGEASGPELFAIWVVLCSRRCWGWSPEVARQ